MATFFFTILPFVLTFTVAAWTPNSTKAQPSECTGTGVSLWT
jgi:hypothetical protein